MLTCLSTIVNSEQSSFVTIHSGSSIRSSLSLWWAWHSWNSHILCRAVSMRCFIQRIMMISNGSIGKMQSARIRPCEWRMSDLSMRIAKLPLFFHPIDLVHPNTYVECIDWEINKSKGKIALTFHRLIRLTCSWDEINGEKINSVENSPERLEIWLFFSLLNPWAHSSWPRAHVTRTELTC